MIDKKHIMSPSRTPSLGHEQVSRKGKYLRSAAVIGVLLGVALVALNITTLMRVSKRSNNDDGTSAALLKGRVVGRAAALLDLESSIRIDEVMSHLNELQRIGSASNGTRAIGSEGFNQTIDFIARYLTANTNYNVTKTIFNVVSDRLARNPIFSSSINGTITNHTYSTNASLAEFYYVQYTTSTPSPSYTELSVIPNLGCFEADWQQARPSPANRVALVKRGECTFVEKAALASKYNVRALLIYNDGVSSDRMSPIFVTLGQNNTLPALFLSFSLGQRLADNARDRPANVRVLIDVRRLYEASIPSANVCADTPTGDPTQTIVIGSHSDSVPAGPGINDNGSGSAANLGLAIALARLFRTSAYPKFKYRVRFCWWGAEEVGLLGSDDHVKKAKNSTIVGDRLQDYLINLNFDMLASPNYIFGIYDGRTARNDTPPAALPGSNKITALFRDWFVRQNLPWDYTDFSGRSDYGPFLAEGIVAGGLFSGADDIKTQKQRDRYDETLGQGMGGIPDVIQDPCYHKACDSIQNVNVFGYEKMVKAAAYALEYLGRQDDLKEWLYPAYEINRLGVQPQKRSHLLQDSMNEYVNSPDS